jgi:hypothetical protein
MIRNLLAAGAVGALMALAACGDGGSAEQAGESIDSAFEEATQGEENLGDGPMEQAGEAIDEATGNENNDPIDALSDATDGDASTNP